MSIQQPPNQGYGSSPPSMQQQAQIAATNGGVPSGGQSPGGKMPLGATAGGGLIVGIALGLLLISGGGDASEAIAAKEPASAAAKPATTYADLLDDSDAPAWDPESDPDSLPTTDLGSEPATDPASDTDSVAANPPPATANPAVSDPAVSDPAVSDPAPKDPVVGPDPPEPDPEPIDVRLRFDVTGIDDDTIASITLNNKPISGTSVDFQIAAGKTQQKAKLVVRARGYRVFKKTLSVKADMRVSVEMRKRPVGGKKNGGSGPGGLLDL
ncbi:MAG: hypothetical protein GY811_20270 [Myxococcales bacterium]|nr:hypothetical protein [Myxococcales bacterium]